MSAALTVLRTLMRRLTPNLTTLDRATYPNRNPDADLTPALLDPVRVLRMGWRTAQAQPQADPRLRPTPPKRCDQHLLGQAAGADLAGGLAQVDGQVAGALPEAEQRRRDAERGAEVL